LTTDTTVAVESDLQRRLRRMIELRTLTRLSIELGISREALLRYLSGVDMQAGTLVLIEAKLAKLDAAPPSPAAAGGR
jgi:hypothetical protein